MCLLAPENPYPIYAPPPLVRNAIIETQKKYTGTFGYGGDIRINSDLNCLSESD